MRLATCPADLLVIRLRAVAVVEGKVKAETRVKAQAATRGQSESSTETRAKARPKPWSKLRPKRGWANSVRCAERALWMSVGEFVIKLTSWKRAHYSLDGVKKHKYLKLGIFGGE